jgi:hypothetical protein
MAIEQWLDSDFDDTRSVIDLGINFETLLAGVSNISDENINYSLVMETQECSSFVCNPVCVLQQLVDHLQGPYRAAEYRRRNHLLKNLLPSLPLHWAGNLLVLKWSSIDGMKDIRYHEIPSIRQGIEM